MSRFPRAHFLLSCADPGQFPPDAGAEVAFAGRSNAGKSSAINAITQRHSLARTSKTPGQTRLLNFFELAPGSRIVDLPGYGYAAVHASERSKWAPLTAGLRERECLRGLFLIVDSRRGITEGDVELIEWADPERHTVHVLLSKADKLGREEARKALRDAKAALGEAATVQLFSATKGDGVEEAQRTLAAWFARRP